MILSVIYGEKATEKIFSCSYQIEDNFSSQELENESNYI
jgi:hypothetical protein